VGIRLDATQVVAVAAFLRVINVLENIRASIELLEAGAQKSFFKREERRRLLGRAVHETQDSIRVLAGGGLHPEAVAHLQDAEGLAKKAAGSPFFARNRIRKAIDEQRRARGLLVESPQ
jgi:copper homeostasis protein CutC